MKKFAILAGAALLAAPALHAQEAAHFDVFYTTGEYSGTDHDGFGVKGKAPIAANVFLHGEYATHTFDAPGDPELDQFRLGGGFQQEVQRGMSFLGKAEWIRLDSDADESNGFGLHAGLGFDATPALKLMASIGYLDIEDGNGHEINLGAALNFTPTVGGVLEYRDAGGDFDFNEIRAGVRLSFGQ